MYTPVYKIEFWSGSTKRRGFGYGYINNELISFRVKPGLTTALGSFEITIVDTGSNASGFITGNAFKDIEVFDTVKMWFGYTGSGLTPQTSEMFTGRIDTKEVSYSESGCYRTFTGRDLGEPLERILQRRMYTGSLYESAVSLKNAAGLASTNTFISGSSDIYEFVQDNTSCFDGLTEISDFDNKDYYTDTGSNLHWFPRQSYLDSTTTFEEGVDILSYKYVKDLADIKNDYYVFGVRDSSSISGSDIPMSHDSWTETNLTGWEGRLTGSGINKSVHVVSYSIGSATGSSFIYTQTGSAPVTYSALRFIKTLPNTLSLNSGDILHFYLCMPTTGLSTPLFVNLHTNGWNDYFACVLESQNNSGVLTWYEYTINLGAAYEGISITGSYNTTTGSYKWERIGNPDWYNITSVSFAYANSSSTKEIDVDGLYFGTKFQYHTSGSNSINAYGLRTEIINDDNINNSLYAKNTGDTKLSINQSPTTQIDITAITRPYVIGTRYPVIINSEDINSNFELIDLEHNWSGNTLTSKCLFTDQAQKRIPVPIMNYPVQAAEDKRNILQKMAAISGGLPLLITR
jgi:hypothetical protein